MAAPALSCTPPTAKLLEKKDSAGIAHTDNNKENRDPLTVAAMILLVLAVTGSALGYLANLPLVPLITASLVAPATYIFLSRDRQASAIGFPLPLSRSLFIYLVAVAAAALVGFTGATTSPLTGLLSLPISLAAMFYGLKGSAVTGLLISSLLLMLIPRVGIGPALFPGLFVTQLAVLNLVAVAIGLFAQRMHRAAGDALARAQLQEARADETQEFLDTSVMMESAYDLDNILNVTLIRLADTVPYDACAVFLREGDEPVVHIARLTGLAAESVSIRSVSLEAIEAQWGSDFTTRYWSRVTQPDAELGPLALLDPAARSVIVAPLSTLNLGSHRALDLFYGLIYVSAHKDDVLTERHRRIVHQFAQYAVFPIQRMRLQDHFREMASTDAMTGLDNYRSFRLRLAEEVRRAYRYGHPVSLILLDIDHFKRVNDTHGHPSGDAILKQIGATLRKTLRGLDIAARYGGEEMAVICPETVADDARTIAERIRATVETHRYALPDGGEIQVTISLGVATLPRHAAGDAALIEQADKALYSAKTGGRNQVRTASDGPNDPPEN